MSILFVFEVILIYYTYIRTFHSDLEKKFILCYLKQRENMLVDNIIKAIELILGKKVTSYIHQNIYYIDINDNLIINVKTLTDKVVTSFDFKNGKVTLSPLSSNNFKSYDDYIDAVKSIFTIAYNLSIHLLLN